MDPIRILLSVHKCKPMLPCTTGVNYWLHFVSLLFKEVQSLLSTDSRQQTLCMELHVSNILAKFINFGHNIPPSPHWKLFFLLSLANFCRFVFPSLLSNGLIFSLIFLSVTYASCFEQMYKVVHHLSP